MLHENCKKWSENHGKIISVIIIMRLHGSHERTSRNIILIEVKSFLKLIFVEKFINPASERVEHVCLFDAKVNEWKSGKRFFIPFLHASRLVLAIFFNIYTVPYEWNREMQFQQTQYSVDYALNKLNDPAFNYSGSLIYRTVYGKTRVEDGSEIPLMHQRQLLTSL
jgi:hypothetical protein